MKDIIEWIDWNDKNNTGEKNGTYGMVKRMAEKKNRWKFIVVNLRDNGDAVD